MITEGILEVQSNKKAKIFPTMTMSGPEQMATDIMILKNCISKTDISLALRFYHWKGLWLSIGKNQKDIPRKWLELANQNKLKIVRRPSGGNAVLHGGGITYSLIWATPPRKRHEAYYKANQWLINGFSKLGLALKFGSKSSNPLENNCFATSTFADLVDSEGQKRIGSAQFWVKGHLLQHGEIILDPPIKLWIDIFNTEPPKPASETIPREGLDKLLYQACSSYWSQLEWEKGSLTKKELEEIAIKSKSYFVKID